LSSKYYKSKANNWLAVATLLLSTACIIDIIGGNISFKSSFIAEFIFNDLTLDFLVYIPFYSYFYTSIVGVYPKKKELFLLCIPFLIDTIINIGLVANFSSDQFSDNTFIWVFYEFETFASLAFNGWLCFKSYKLIEKLSNDQKQKKWLYKIWRSTLLLIILFLGLNLLILVDNTNIIMMASIMYLIVTCWMFWLIYLGIVNLNLLEDRTFIKEKLERLDSINSEKENTTLSEITVQTLKHENEVNDNKNSTNETFSEHFKNISELMQNEHLYRNENLSVNDIAERIGMSAGYVSQIIRKSTNSNVPSWINDYRVSEVKQMLSDKAFENYTIAAIGLEAGFKSKSAFYASFKKKTGVSPVNYRKICPDFDTLLL
jgi:AraC-like DNA-binding protein